MTEQTTDPIKWRDIETPSDAVPPPGVPYRIGAYPRGASINFTVGFLDAQLRDWAAKQFPGHELGDELFHRCPKSWEIPRAARTEIRRQLREGAPKGHTVNPHLIVVQVWRNWAGAGPTSNLQEP